MKPTKQWQVMRVVTQIRVNRMRMTTSKMLVKQVTGKKRMMKVRRVAVVKRKQVKMNPRRSED